MKYNSQLNILNSDPDIVILKGESRNLLHDISNAGHTVIVVGQKSDLAAKVRHKVTLNTLELKCPAKHSYAKKLIEKKTGGKLPRGFIKACAGSREKIVVLDADTIPRLLTTERLASRHI